MAINLTLKLEDNATPVIKKFVDTTRKGMRRVSKNVESESKKIDKSLTKAFKGLKGLRQFAIAGIAGGALVAFGREIVLLAANAEETRSKFNVVFKDIEQGANRAFEALANQLKRNKDELKDFGSLLGSIIKPIGFTTKEAFALSRQMTVLALDVASFSNAQDTDVLRAFAAALTGERESLKTYGIVINEAQIKQEAFRLGLAKTTKDLDQRAKTLATVSLLQQKTTDQQGDLIRTQASAVNQFKQFNANIRTLGTSLGEILLPAINAVTTALNSMISTAEDAVVLGEVAKDLSNILGTAPAVTQKFIQQAKQLQEAAREARKEAERSAQVRRFAVPDIDSVLKFNLAAKDATLEVTSIGGAVDGLNNSLERLSAQDVINSFKKDAIDAGKTIQDIDVFKLPEVEIVTLQELDRLTAQIKERADVTTDILEANRQKWDNIKSVTGDVLDNLNASGKTIDKMNLGDFIKAGLGIAASFAGPVGVGATAALGIGKLFGFAHGGSFEVPGGGGTDSQPVAFKATPGERVTIETPQQQRESRESGPITINITTNNLSDLDMERMIEIIKNRQDDTFSQQF